MSVNNFLGTSEATESILLAGGGVKTVSGLENIAQQIKRVLLIEESDIFYSAGYGSKLYKLQFMQNDAVTRALIKSLASDAIKAHVPSVKSFSISFQDMADPQSLLITVSFKSISEQESQTSFVFQFQ